MSFSGLFRWLISDATIYASLPAAFLCYIPMSNKLRRPQRSIAIHCAILLFFAVIGTSFLTTKFPFLDGTVILLPFLGIFFVYYATSTRASVPQSTGIFLMICGFYGVISYGAYVIDAAIRISGGSGDSNHFLYICQLGLILLLTIPAAMFLRRVGVYLADHLQEGPVWVLIGAISIAIFAILSVMAPHLSTLDEVPELRKVYMIVAALVSLIYILACAFFFLSSGALIRKEELQEQETVYRMQREQYSQLEDQTERMRILRHDFRHALGAIQKLAEDNDIDGIREYLAQYADSIPNRTLIRYCDSDLINAILNHYSARAEEKQTRTEFLVDIPPLSES